MPGLELGGVPLGQQTHALLADVVARAGVLLAGVAEPEHEPIERGALAGTPIEEAHRSKPVIGRRSLAAVGGVAGRLAVGGSTLGAFATLALGAFFGAFLGGRDGVGLELVGASVSTVTSGVSGSATAVTPAGSVMSPSVMTVSIVMSVMSITISSGMLRGVVRTSIVSTAGSTRPPADMTSLASPSRRSGIEIDDLFVEVDLQEVDVSDVAADRVTLELLDDRRVHRCRRP